VILFDRDTKNLSTELERLPETFSTEITKGHSAELIWKEPADVLRGEEVLTEEGWQQAREGGWQLYHRFDEPYGLTVKGSGIRRVMLPRIYWRDGRPAVQVRSPRDDFYDLSSPEELYLFNEVPLDGLQPAIDQLGALTIRGADGKWKLIHELVLPKTRGGKIKVGRARGVSHSAGGHEVYKFWLLDYGDKCYAVDMRWTLSEANLNTLAGEELRHQEGF